MRWSIRLLRDAEAVDLGDLFLVGAVVAVLAIRVYLNLTGFPKVGGGVLHISHMLWGGLLLLIGVFLYATFLDRRVRPIAAVVAGVGFGTFIDEIGKFVTADNDYFFKPTGALIYLALVGVFLLVRATQVRRMLAPQDALAEALILAANAQGGQLDVAARRRALGLIAQADHADPLVEAVHRYLEGVPTAGDAPLASLLDRVERLYLRVEGESWFERFLAVVFGLYAIGSVVAAGVLLIAFGDLAAGGDVVNLGLAISAIASGLLVARGLLLLPTSRLAAYHYATWGILVSLLVTQPFLFYVSEPFAILGLVANLLAYAGVRTLIAQERAAVARRALVKKAVS
ncbi:MAG: hypothetical protein ACHQZR_01260 [Candidatus Limnocylindrales bacterium]